jgi:diguanylate cyclase (GGDEF)-like protein
MSQDLLSRITALESTVQRFKVLVEASSAIVACTALDEALSAITKVLTERLDVAWANVYDYHPATNQFEVLAFYQIPGLDINTEGWIGTHFDYYSNSSWATALQERRPVIWYSDAPSLVPAEVAERIAWGELSSITVPLLFRDEVIGLLDVGEARSLRRYDAVDVAVAQAIADHAAIAIDNARTRAQLEEQAITDGLTGLYNHRFLQERLRQEVAAAHRYKRELGVLMVDIDDFKNFNDAFGHPQGDELLRATARTMLEDMRHDVDVVARYGGDEFCVLMPDGEAGKNSTVVQSASTAAERIRSATEVRGFRGDGGNKPAPVTVSIGVAALRAHGATADELLSSADKALYAAKAQGKNRVCVFGA